jgi:O-antigen/teichoic acid export membrane protein
MSEGDPVWVGARAFRWTRARLAGRDKVKASFVYATSSLFCQVLRFAGLAISTRMIEPAQFGLFAQATLVLSFTALSREIGQSNALISYSGNDRRYATFHFQLNLTLSLLAVAILVCLVSFFALLPGEIRRAAPLLAAILLVEGLLPTGLLMCQKALRFGLLGVADVIALSGWLAVVMSFNVRLEGFLVLLLAQLTEGSLRLIIVMAAEGWRHVGWANGKDLRAYYFHRFAKPMIPQILFQTVGSRIDYLLLIGLNNVTELGIYERILQFVRIPWSLSINLIDRVLLVSYSQQQADPAALGRLLRKANAVIAVAVVAAVSAASLGFHFFLGYIVGPGWATTIMHYWWIALPFTLVTPFVWNLNIFFQGVGQPKRLLENTILLAVCELIFGFCLTVAGYGAAGMLTARGLAFGILLAWQYISVRRYLASGKSQLTDAAPLPL